MKMHSSLRKNPNFIDLSGDKALCSICGIEFCVESLESYARHLVCRGCVNMIQAIAYKEKDKEG